MKPCICMFVVAAVAGAQSATTTYLTDLNGVRVQGISSTTSKDGEKTERWQSINGRQVPLEQVTEKVIREDANGKVTEKTIRRFDATGQPSTPERVVTEETKLAGGGSTVRSTTYQTDINGNVTPAERRTVETRVQGTTTTAQTVVERPSMNGSFNTVEKRTAATNGTEANRSTTESVYRSDGNGGFREELRYVKTVATSGDQTIENTADYEPGLTGRLELHAQSSSTVRKLPDGSEVSEVNLYSSNVPGRLQDNLAAQQIKEQQIIERRVLPNGSVTETLSVRRPSISDPTRLGDLQKLSETVCTGKCVPDKPAPTPPPAPAKPAAGNSRP